MDYDFTGARVVKKSVIKDVSGKTWQTVTHYLGEAMEIRLSPVDITSPLPPGEGQGEGAAQKGTVLLHVAANGQRVATMTVGTLADVLKPAAGTIWGIPFTQLPPLVAFSLLLAMLIAVMPGLTRHPVCRAQFALSLSKGAIVALLLIGIQIAGIPLALAGDSGTPAIPPSDANYFVFYHGDHLGSAQLITEGNTKGKHAGITYKRGDVIQRFEYAAYGRESFALNPNLSWDPAFTGQQYDIETGLYYYRARYYNPILGRFIQPDTVVQNPLDPQSWNRYAYVKNNPLKYTDPTGHEPHFDMPDDYDHFVHGRDRDNDHDFHFSDSAEPSGHEGGLIGAVAVVNFAINSMTGGHSEQVIGAGKALMEGAAWLLDTMQSWGPTVQLSAEDQMMMDFVMGMSMGGGIKIVGSEIAVGLRAVGRGLSVTRNGAPLYRYVMEDEIAAIKSTGQLRGKRPGSTYFTDQVYSSSTRAQQRLGLDTKPTHRVEFEITNSPKVNGPNSVDPLPERTGKGREYWSDEAVKARIINVQPLK